MGILNNIRSFFSTKKEAKALYEGAGRQKTRIKELIKEYKELERWNIEYSEAIHLLTDSLQVLIYTKDRNDRYIIANSKYCEKIFCLNSTKECLDFIRNKTCSEIVHELFHNKNLMNTLPGVCIKSDLYSKAEKTTCHFIEAGKVIDDNILLYTMKTPIYKDEIFNGIVAVSWDVTEHSAFLINLLNRWIYGKKVVELYKDNSVFSYALKPSVGECNIFKHICPYPHNKEYCDNECNSICPQN